MHNLFGAVRANDAPVLDWVVPLVSFVACPLAAAFAVRSGWRSSGPRRSLWLTVALALAALAFIAVTTLRPAWVPGPLRLWAEPGTLAALAGVATAVVWGVSFA